MTERQPTSPHPARWVPTLYFAEGLPFIATNVVSVMMYRNMGLSDTQTAFFTSLVALPWMLRALWSPFLEMFRTRKHFVVATQFLAGVCFGALALTLPLEGYLKYSLVLFALIAFNAATHDMAADGIYIGTLSAKQQAEYSGWQGASFNIATLFAQGGLVFVAGQLERALGVTTAWMIVMGVCGAILVALSLYHTAALPSGQVAGEVQSARQVLRTFREVVGTFFQKKYVWWGIAFIVLYRFAEGNAQKIVQLFLKAPREVGGMGLSTSEVGLAYGLMGAVAFVGGSLAGGYFAASRGLKGTLPLFCAAYNIPYVAYLLLALTMPSRFSVISVAVAAEMFGYGFGAVGLTLFMMQQIAPGPFKTAHYAFATGLMNLGMNLPSMVSGYLSDRLGYRDFFIWVMVATIPSFLVTWLVPLKEGEADAAPAPEARAAGA